MSNSLRPHGLQPPRLLCPWDSPGKNTGVDCHFLLYFNVNVVGPNPRWLLSSEKEEMRMQKHTEDQAYETSEYRGSCRSHWQRSQRKLILLMPWSWTLTRSPPELWENKIVLFKSPNLWYFVVAVLANQYSGNAKWHITKGICLLVG